MSKLEEKRTIKKNQHFVPRFYLKYFSLEKNEKEVRLFNVRKNKFIYRASLGDQASERFYYGKDGELEDELSNSEGIFAKNIRDVIAKGDLPKHGSTELRQLLHFAVMTESRNPIRKAALEKTTEMMYSYMIRHNDFPEELKQENISLSLTDPVAACFVNYHKSVVLLSDLHVKLLINETEVPFISSDNPVIQYNQFLEQKTSLRAVTGYAQKGLQIIVPLNEKYALLFYDSQVYYVGGKKGKRVKVSNEEDINQLNLLQLMNCNYNVYGNERMTENYINTLHEKFVSLPRARETFSVTIPSGQNSLITAHGESSCLTKMVLSFVAFSTHAERFRDTGQMNYGRLFALDAIDAFRNEPRFRD